MDRYFDRRAGPRPGPETVPRRSSRGRRLPHHTATWLSSSRPKSRPPRDTEATASRPRGPATSRAAYQASCFLAGSGTPSLPPQALTEAARPPRPAPPNLQPRPPTQRRGDRNFLRAGPLPPQRRRAAAFSARPAGIWSTPAGRADSTPAVPRAGGGGRREVCSRGRGVRARCSPASNGRALLRPVAQDLLGVVV